MKKIITMVALAAICFGTASVAAPVKAAQDTMMKKKMKMKKKTTKMKMKKKMMKDTTKM